MNVFIKRVHCTVIEYDYLVSCRRPSEDQSERPRVQRERGFAMKPRKRKQIDQEFEQDEMSVSTTG